MRIDNCKEKENKCSKNSNRSCDNRYNDAEKCEKASENSNVKKCGCHGSEQAHKHDSGEACHCHGCKREREREEHGCGCGCEHEHGGEGLSSSKILTYIIGGVLLILAFLGELGHLTPFAAIPCAAAVYVYFGKDVWVGAYKSVMKKKFFTEFTLMCTASLGAILLGEFADAAAVIYLYSLGEAVSGEAYSRSRRNIAELIEITRENVTVVKDGSAKTISAERAEIGDIISVRVGDKISLDGVVVEGNGFADTSAVTGESVPRELSVGDRCLSGSSLISGALFVKVTEKYENSTANRLKLAVERAAKQKAPTEKRITRFAEVFTPAAFCVAMLVFVIGAFVKESVGDAVRSALVVLVASCPCALVLSVPLAYFSGIGRAAGRGIVFRGGRVIDNAAALGTVLFDKTGTLTSSTPRFVGVVMPDGSPVTKNELLDMSKAALLKSPHASARSFCERYKETVTYKAECAKNIGGRGLVCKIGGKTAVFGNRKLMTELGVKAESVDKSAIYVAVDGKLCGVLVFDSDVKENALTEVSGLRGNGVRRVVIMSGDNEKAVKAVADEIGVGEYYSELKPDEKLERLNNIYKEEKKSHPNETVAFCGDGLNDSAAIARADVGIAMGSGSALTVESADVVIVDDNLTRLNEMLVIAKGTVRIVTQNIVLSLGVKLAVVLVGMFWYPSLELAVVADVGAAVLTVLNAMRAGGIKK